MSFPAPRSVEANGLRMTVYEQGAGLPVVLCHGFPEIAYSWRRQLPAIAAAGFRAIAPDQRGYGDTGAAPGASGADAVPLYDMEHLTADMVGLLDALELDKAVFCGHDWGGFVAWQMPLRHPGRVAGVIGVNTPFMPRGGREPIATLRAVFGDSMYIVYFQEFGKAEALLDEDVPRTVRFWFRKNMVRRADSDTRPDEHNFMDVYRRPEDTWGGEALLSAEEAARYTAAFEKTGYTGPINWYRNLTRNWERSADLKDRINVPGLMISAANDVVLPPKMADGMEAYVPDLERHVIPDCGHWTQQEKPGELNALITDWLKRRFS